MIRPREYLICFVAGLTLSAVTPVYAQDAAGDDNVLEEIVVTATKMGGTAQETPIALTVLTGDALIESGITDIHDLPNVAPGVEVENGFFGPVIAIRGITTTDSTPKGNEGIGYTINGINVGRPRERALAFFDIERIEVLRGPQGTLFGKATSGGVVSVVTRRPGEEFGGKIDLELSNFNTIRTTAGLDMPVSDNVKLRLALNSNNSEGWREDLTLTFGLRWSEDGVSRRGTFALGTGYPPGPPPPGVPPNAWRNPDGEPCRAPDPCIGVPNNADQENTKVTYRLGLDYDVSDTGMIYGSIATGYKAGGFSDFGPAGPLAGADYYSPEDLIAYEAGYKGDITDTLTYNTSVFFYDYEVMQLSYVREVAFATFVLFTVTAPTEVSGWENELSWRPDDQSQLDLELRLGDSQYVDFDAGARGNTPFGPGVPFTSWDGFALDRMPEAAGAVTYSRNFALENGATLIGRVRTKYSSGYLMSDIPNAFQYEQGSFTRTDLNLTYRSADQRLGIGLFLRNLEDELQATSGIGGFRPPDRANEITVNVNRPRTYGITLAYDF